MFMVSQSKAVFLVCAHFLMYFMTIYNPELILQGVSLHNYSSLNETNLPIVHLLN